jgi:hypothetical protein
VPSNPSGRERQRQAVRATQVAFEMETRLAARIRVMAAEAGLTPSDQIRKMLGLPFSKPVRPRLTISLAEDDYAALAARYGTEAEDRLGVKKRLIEELAGLVQE